MVARDIQALGSNLFYGLVIVRAIVGQYEMFLYQLLLGLGGVLLIQAIISFDANMARGILLGAFTSLYYQDALFTAMTVCMAAALTWAEVKLGETRIILGITIGVLLSGISYAVTYFL